MTNVLAKKVKIRSNGYEPVSWRGQEIIDDLVEFESQGPLPLRQQVGAMIANLRIVVVYPEALQWSRMEAERRAAIVATSKNALMEQR